MLGSAFITDVNWVIVVLLLAIVLAAALSISHVAVAVVQDALPILLLLAWVALVVALVERAWILAAFAGAACIYHLSLTVPRLLSARRPHWAATAPTLEVIVANVFIDNQTPDVKARQLVETGADVIVITEWNPTFATAFDAAGGDARYPHRLCDDGNRPDYKVCIASRAALEDSSQILELDTVRIADAVVRCGEVNVHVMGLNAMAVVDPNGFEQWKAQFETLIDRLPDFELPFVLAGDLNTTQFRPEYRKLLRRGVVDAHDSLGKGLTTSFQLAAHGVLSSPGSIVRLDHALLSDGVAAMEAEDLDACGSDHQPFRLV